MITLTQMTEMARALVEAEHATERAEVALKEAKERERILREETLPSAMQELGVELLRLESGEELSMKQDVYASIPAASKVAAFKWLEDGGFSGLIKTDVVISYGRDEASIARKMLADLGKKGLSVKLNEAVNPQTLKAFLREQIAEGTDIPLELFGARPVWTAKVK